MRFYPPFFAIAFACISAIPAFAAESYFPKSVSAVICGESVQAKLKSAFGDKKPNWHRVIDPNFETRAFRASPQLAEWYELRIPEHKAAELWYYSPSKTTSFRWMGKSCELATKDQAPLKFGNTDAEAQVFTDAELAKLMADHSQGVIYLWSPRMVYSMLGAKGFTAVAAKRKMAFTAVLDFAVPTDEALQAMKAQHVSLDSPHGVVTATDIRRLASIELYMREGTLHFPMVFVYKNGHIHPHRVVGYLSAEGFNKAVDQWMGEMP